MGNIVTSSNTANWTIMCDYNGETTFTHVETGEVSYFPPEAYANIPPGKSPKVFIGEAAFLTLNYIKTMIASNLARLKAATEEAADPKNKKKKGADGENGEDERVDALEDQEDLSKYVYDIQTVEMMATFSDEGAASAKADAKRLEAEAADGIGAISSGDKDHKPIVFEYIGPSIADVNPNAITIDEVRKILENFSDLESKLESRLGRVHENVRVFFIST